ncbi:MAG TPA: sigma-70 family RNA polymerase sigma factor [Planctomycetaceae bacterium]|nr:sigma-70 family RNA polymerase sigma factor [Planctomycetaceae bacterium]
MNAIFVEEILSNCQTEQQAGQATVVSLVRAAQAGDRDAFGQLFERYRPGIVSLAMKRVRNADEAEELAQDVFVQAMQKLDQLRVPEAFGGWLRRIVHRMAINRLTRRPAAMSCDPFVLEATCLSSGDSPEQDASEREQAEDVRAAVQRLGKLDRQTLQAFYLRGQTLLQMSDAFDAPVGTIKRRLHVARKRLAREMEVSQAV